MNTEKLREALKVLRECNAGTNQTVEAITILKDFAESVLSAKGWPEEMDKDDPHPFNRGYNTALSAAFPVYAKVVEENKKMREALQEIIDIYDTCDEDDDACSMFYIVKSALKEGKG